MPSTVPAALRTSCSIVVFRGHPSMVSRIFTSATYPPSSSLTAWARSTIPSSVMGRRSSGSSTVPRAAQSASASGLLEAGVFELVPLGLCSLIRSSFPRQSIRCDIRVHRVMGLRGRVLGLCGIAGYGDSLLGAWGCGGNTGADQYSQPTTIRTLEGTQPRRNDLCLSHHAPGSRHRARS